MAHKKGTGSTRNGRDSKAKRLGVKRFGGEEVPAGAIIVRQRGTKIHPGKNVGRGGDDTLYARTSGTVVFERRKKNGKKVSVYPFPSDNSKQDVTPLGSSKRTTPSKGRVMVTIKQPFKDGFKTLALYGRPFDNSPRHKGAVVDREKTWDIPDRSKLDDKDLALRYLEQVLGDEQPQFFVMTKNKQKTVEFKLQDVRAFKRTGTTTIRFRQYYQDVPLYGSMAIIELNKERELVSLNSAIAEPFDLEASARINKDEVLEIVSDAAGHSSQKELNAEQIHLYFFFDSNSGSRWRLVFITPNVVKHNVTNQDFLMPEVVDYVVDANSGDIIAELPRTQ